MPTDSCPDASGPGDLSGSGDSGADPDRPATRGLSALGVAETVGVSFPRPEAAAGRRRFGQRCFVRYMAVSAAAINAAAVLVGSQ